MNAPIPNHYDEANAAALVQFAAEAYTACLGAQCVWDPTTDTFVAFWETETDLIVAIRGTRSPKNFVTDAEAWRVPLRPNCVSKIHAGFKSALDSVWNALEAKLVVANQLPRRIWLTGHSLGGALAMLAAQRTRASIAGVYTFGQPRVGNKAFCDLYDTFHKFHTFRVVDAEDFITRIPWLLKWYRHCGTEAFYPSFDNLPLFGSRYWIDPPLWKKAFSDIFGTWQEYTSDGRIALLADHHVAKYQALFDTYANRETSNGSAGCRQADVAPEGPGRDGNKPLMQNRGLEPIPGANTAGALSKNSVGQSCAFAQKSSQGGGAAPPYRL